MQILLVGQLEVCSPVLLDLELASVGDLVHRFLGNRMLHHRVNSLRDILRLVISKVEVHLPRFPLGEWLRSCSNLVR